MDALMNALGNPHRDLAVIHITGTSGKGSVAAYCESILLEHGLQVGTHTSPYLQTPLEKIRINGLLISPTELVKLAHKVMDSVDELHAVVPDLGKVHYAEAWVGMSLLHFAEQSVDVTIVEVGMGGRFDATNIVDSRISIINSVHYDHTRVLGETLTEIAYHKAGIIKHGQTVVAGDLGAEALQVVVEETKQRQAHLQRLGKDFLVGSYGAQEAGCTFDYHGRHLAISDLEAGLLGRHQAANAATALTAVAELCAALAIPIKAQAIRNGIRNTRLAGRIEIVARNPITILDGAHNEEKIEALTQTVIEHFPGRRLIVVLALLTVKDVAAIVTRLASVADTIITTETRVRGKPGFPADELAERIKRMRFGSVHSILDAREAIEAAQRIAGIDDLIAVTGSLYLVGAVRERWYPTDSIIAQQTMYPDADYSC